MTKKVLQYFRTHSLVKRGEVVVCGISGGPDSVFLGTTLSMLKKPLDISIVFAHINYHLREDSDLDEEIVKKLAKKHRAPLFVHHAAPEKTDEATLRKIRFSFFDKIKKQHNAQRTAIGHTADDATETFLLSLLRGSGSKGLSGMPPKTDSVIRPLLFLTKKEIIDYLTFHKITFATDSSNAKPQYTRNKIRNTILPYIKKEINPSIEKTLESTSLCIALDYDYLLKHTANAFNAIAKKTSSKSIELNRAKWRALHPALQLHVLRHAIHTLKGNLTNISAPRLLSAQKTLISKSDIPKTVELPEGLRISKKHDKIRLSF